MTNVSEHGFWLLVAGRELFLPFEHFPWFEEVAIGQLVNVQLLHGDHPDRFPLISRSLPNKRMQPTRGRRRAPLSRRTVRG